MSTDTKKIWEKMSELDERIKSIERLIEKKPELVESNSNYSKLENKTGISESELKNMIYFEDETFTLLVEIPGKNNKEKMIKGSLILLTIDDICYGSNRMRSQDLRKKLEYAGVGSLAHLSTHIRSIKRLIIPDGKKGSNNFGYRLTVPGKIEGIKIMTELVNI